MKKTNINNAMKQMLMIMLATFSIALVFVCSRDSTYFQKCCIILTCIYIIIGSFFGIKDIKNRSVFCMFNLMYFIFLVGGIVVEMFNDGNLLYYLFSSTEAVNHVCISLLLSIAIINTVYICCRLSINSRNKINIHSDNTSFISNRTLLIRNLVFYILIISFMSKLIMSLEMTIYLRLTSYLDYYTTYVSHLPSIIHFAGSVFYFSLFIYLATIPSKKQVKIAFVGVLLIEAIILSAGDRGEPLSVMASLIFYVFWRNRNGFFDVVFKKRTIIIFIICLPIIMFSLQKVSYIRNDDDMDLNFTDGVIEFLSKQGTSVIIISKGYDLRERIGSIGGHQYTFGIVRNYLQQNVISRNLFGIRAIRTNTIEAATSGNSYGSSMAHIRFPKSYLAGVGCGTSYIAELYHDWGYIGIIIGSIFIVFLLFKIENTRNNSIILSAISLNLVRYTVLLPRGAFFSWLTNVITLQNIILIVLLIIIHKRTEIYNEKCELEVKV